MAVWCSQQQRGGGASTGQRHQLTTWAPLPWSIRRSQRLPRSRTSAWLMRDRLVGRGLQAGAACSNRAGPRISWSQQLPHGRQEPREPMPWALHSSALPAVLPCPPCPDVGGGQQPGLAPDPDPRSCPALPLRPKPWPCPCLCTQPPPHPPGHPCPHSPVMCRP